MIGLSSGPTFHWTQNGINSNTVRKRLRGPRQDYGDGLSANGKTGLFGSNYQSFMSEGTKHLTMPTSAASAISRLGQAPLFASRKDGERAVELSCTLILLPVPRFVKVCGVSTPFGLSGTILRSGSRWLRLSNTASRLPKNMMSRHSAILSCLCRAP